MKKYCVIGHPINHSKSPALHEAGFVEMNLDAEFGAVEVTPENLSTWMTDDLTEYAGAAVTIPHKEKVMDLVDTLSEAAQKIGAVNTLYWEDEQVIGTNTDCIGAIRALGTECEELEGKKVLVLGAGGASRAIIFGLKQAGCHVSIWNRTSEKAAYLADEFEVDAVENIRAISGDQFDIIINTTSVGLKSWESVLSEDFYAPQNIVMDIVYDPLETKLLADAEAAGCATITGDKMLVFQAIAQFQLWHGIELEPEVMGTAFFK